MARPQVFVSSTYYDLKSVREDIGRFLRDYGFDVIRHEVGRVPYSKGQSLEASCLREVEACDILICVIGGRFGSSSESGHQSITQAELTAAIDSGKQVFVFVERPVYIEFDFYESNKQLQGLKLRAATDARVYDFIRGVRELPIGYPIFPFDTSSEIVSLLREQFAGIFQRLLSERGREQTASLVAQLQSSLASVSTLVAALAKEKDSTSSVFRAFLDANHPIFEAVASALRLKFRVYFSSLAELNRLLAETKGLAPVERQNWDEPNVAEWFRVSGSPNEAHERTQWIFKLPVQFFDESGKLKPSDGQAIDRNSISYTSAKIHYFENPAFDDEAPF